MQRETTSSVTGTVYYNRYNNPHPNYEGWAATSLGTSNTYSNCIFDGDNYHSSDAGDSITAQGEATISNCIGINKSGPLVVGNGSTGKHTVSHCTVVMPFPEQPAYGELINVGETTGSATHLTAVKDCIIMDAPRGIAQRSAFISQTGFALDYNVSYNITGTSLFTYPVGHPYAGQTSYLGPEDFNPWWSPSKTFGTDNATHDMVVDPKLRNKNWTVRGYFGAASIQDVAREVVSINGIDYQGNTTTPTTKSAETIWASAVWAFSPTNGLLRKAGDDGITIGASEWSNPRRK
jgi:hypothetical protein